MTRYLTKAMQDFAEFLKHGTAIPDSRKRPHLAKVGTAVTSKETMQKIVIDKMTGVLTIPEHGFEYGQTVAIVVEYDGKFHGVEHNWQSIVLGSWVGDEDNDRISIGGKIVEGCRVVGYYPTEWRELP